MEGVNWFGAVAVYCAEDVVCLRFCANIRFSLNTCSEVGALLRTNRSQCRSVRNRRVRTQEHHEVREVCDAYSEI